MSYLQDLAYLRDERTQAISERWWGEVNGELVALRDEFRSEDRDEEIETEWVHVRFVVCPLCGGKDKHVNPSIDAHGLTRDDFDEDPDFAESYFRGDYDQPCNLCEGEKVVPIPLEPTIADMIEKQIAEIAY